MNYYLLGYSENEKDRLNMGQSPIVVNSYELPDLDLRALWKGKYIKIWPNNLQLYYEKGNIILDYIPNVLSWLILSEKATGILKELNTKIQYFPICVCNIQNKKKCFSVNVINILETVPALDWEKSDYVSWEDDCRYIKFIKKIVLKNSHDYLGLDIFRLEECKNYIIVSEKVKRCFEIENLRGFEFMPVENS